MGGACWIELPPSGKTVLLTLADAMLATLLAPGITPAWLMRKGTQGRQLS
jgi:hypothetical protein